MTPCVSFVALTSCLTYRRPRINFTTNMPITAILIVCGVTALIPKGVFTTLDRYWHHTTCFFVSHASFSGICWNHSGGTFALWNTFTSATHLTTAITSSIRAAVKVRTSATTIIPGHHSRTLMTAGIVLTTVARFDAGTMLISDVSKITDAHWLAIVLPTCVITNNTLA